MTRIALFCAAGMSTSMLVKKMKEAAVKANIDVEINAYPENDLPNQVKGLDVALLGPQVGYTLKKMKPVCDEANVPVAVIPSVDYGMMNGEKVLRLALSIVK